MSDEHMNANKYLKGRFINIGNIITDTTNNWQFQVEMEQTNEDSCFADTISVLTFLNQFAEENEQLKKRNKKRLQRLKNQRKQLEKQQEAIWGYKGDIKQLKKENEELKKELNNCEKFRYIVFKRMDELRK